MPTPPAQGEDPRVEWKERLKGSTKGGQGVMEAEATGRLEEDMRSASYQREERPSKHQEGLHNMRVLAEDETRAQMQERESTAATPLGGNAISTSLQAEKKALFARFKKERERSSQQNRQQEQPPGPERPPKPEVWLPESTAPPAPPNRIPRSLRKHESPNVGRPAQAKHQGLRDLFNSNGKSHNVNLLHTPSVSQYGPPRLRG
ncbi:hypothetical protein FA13DRAFT_1518708 [Coprinellus micaceus]|uniref:Uncharacterized protein n=1 Tax=Coprinellus micaceus TaxID=71717 RepID=A0A4Y7SM58_COPMI|nr:hypothetical protein FA13DRAFT_1518708 [Coprinellus micaceus]